MSVLRLYFGWPAGAVYSNLLASAICAGLVWWRLRARMILHHAEHLAETERRHLEHLAQAERHHADLKEHTSSCISWSATDVAGRRHTTRRPGPS